ncbi:hypothetical protein CcCBS67573_g01331 [Chytriomyces confervae]|uniref:F-box domain-containing protein n=1 Tax=Chytriomyces confervae TaxID=246404 RepID=A0A507FMA1_9FUNG|nr:hypothetical protein CcCBS67573_g01331 [Chytriomyces confervae]
MFMSYRKTMLSRTSNSSLRSAFDPGLSASSPVPVGLFILPSQPTSSRHRERLPIELLALVFSFVSDKNTLSVAACVCVRWNIAATPALWSSVSISSADRLLKFTRCVVLTVARHSEARQLLSLIPAIDSSILTNTESLPKVSLPSADALMDIPGGFFPHLQQLNNMNNGDAAMNGGAPPFAQAFAMHPLLAEHLQNANIGADGVIDLPDGMPEGMIQFMQTLVQLQDHQMAAMNEDQSKDTVQAAETFEQLRSLVNVSQLASFGSATYVKKLEIPSFECGVRHVSVLSELLPSLQSLHFMHIHNSETHTPDSRFRSIFTPLPISVLRCFAPLIMRVIRLTCDDMFPTTWPEFLAILNTSAALPLKLLNLEAVATADTFDSAETLSPTFRRLPHLEAARFDGIAFGGVETASEAPFRSLSQGCPNLSVLVLDYCPNVCMSAFSVIWNENPNLVFLGLAGVMNTFAHWDPLAEEMPATETEIGHDALKVHSRMRVVRFVDCQVTDALFTAIAHASPRLDMFRCVFEDDACPGIASCVRQLTGRWLAELAEVWRRRRRDSGNAVAMTRLALTMCPGYNLQALRECIIECGVEVLDLHKDVDSGLGKVAGTLLKELIETGGMAGVRVLNLYGQNHLSDETLRSINYESLPNIKSLCINDTKVGLTTIYTLLQRCAMPPPSSPSSKTKPHKQGLESLSIQNCPKITLEGLKDIFESIFGFEAVASATTAGSMDSSDLKGKVKTFGSLKRLYSEMCWNVLGFDLGNDKYLLS